MFQEYRKGDFLISTDQSKLDLKTIHNFLRKSYWAENIPYEIFKTSVEHSLCFGIYHHSRQIGFARLVTDFSTIAYLTDMFILEDYKNDDLLTWMIKCILSHPELQKLRRWLLAKKNGLYAPYQFAPLHDPESFMEIYRPDTYKKHPDHSRSGKQ